MKNKIITSLIINITLLSIVYIIYSFYIFNFINPIKALSYLHKWQPMARLNLVIYVLCMQAAGFFAACSYYNRNYEGIDESLLDQFGITNLIAGFFYLWAAIAFHSITIYQ